MQYVTPAGLVCRCSFTHEANSCPQHCTKDRRCYLHRSLTAFPLVLWEPWSLSPLKGRVRFSPATSLSYQRLRQANLECKWYLQLDYRNKSLPCMKQCYIVQTPNATLSKLKQISTSTGKAFSNLPVTRTVFRKAPGHPSPHFERAACMCDLAANL